jgi:hypothetical protein
MLLILMILLILTVLVLIIAFVRRWQLRNEELYRTNKSKEISREVIRYVSGEIGISGVEKILKKQSDYIILLEQVRILDKTLEGKENERLQGLMDLDKIRKHFEKRFSSGDPIFQAKACLYFAKKAEIPVPYIAKLVDLSANKNPLLSYAATSALMAHGGMKHKSIAIKNVLKNKRVSEMALSDLLVQLTKYGNEHRDEEAFLFMSLIDDPEIEPDRTAIIIRILHELEYHTTVEFLLNYYDKLDLKKTDPEILKAILDALSKFGREEILDDIHEKFTRSKESGIREAAAKSLGFFRKKESLPILQKMLNDPDYMVRFEAARSLSRYGNMDLKTISPPGLSEKEWNDLAGEVLAESESNQNNK